MALKHAQRFQDLVAYQKARELSKRVFELTKVLPKDEQYSLCSQIRRSSRSVGAHIAESWGKRRYPKHFISKLTEADSEQLETRHWIFTAMDCSYWPDEQARALLNLTQELGRILSGVIAKTEQFCNDHAAFAEEAPGEYGIITNLDTD